MLLCCPLQVISQLPAAGEVLVRELSDMQGEVFNAPVVVLSQNLGGKHTGGRHGRMSLLTRPVAL